MHASAPPAPPQLHAQPVVTVPTQALALHYTGGAKSAHDIAAMCTTLLPDSGGDLVHLDRVIGESERLRVLDPNTRVWHHVRVGDWVVAIENRGVLVLDDTWFSILFADPDQMRTTHNGVLAQTGSRLHRVVSELREVAVALDAHMAFEARPERSPGFATTWAFSADSGEQPAAPASWQAGDPDPGLQAPGGADAYDNLSAAHLRPVRLRPSPDQLRGRPCEGNHYADRHATIWSVVHVDDENVLVQNTYGQRVTFAHALEHNGPMNLLVYRGTALADMPDQEPVVISSL